MQLALPFLPDRFDMLSRRRSARLEGIIVPVDDALAAIDRQVLHMQSSGRGAFLILHGESGSGKSTFLNTIALFRESIETTSIGRDEYIPGALQQQSLMPTRGYKVVVVDGREALTDFSRAELETALHAINTYIRSEHGERSIVVWPCNTPGLRDALTDIAQKLGGETLLPAAGAMQFNGPSRSEYVDIAERTIHVLNDGASLLDLGISRIRAAEIAQHARTIGAYIALLRNEMINNNDHLVGLLKREQCRLWIVVAAGNDPEGDVAALTRGSLSTVDLDRLVTATKANIVEETKRHQEKLGILATVLDAKILYVPTTTALAVARDFAGSALRIEMAQRTLQVRGSGEAVERIAVSELGLALKSQPLGVRTVGGRPGSNTREAFEKLAGIAQDKDSLLNEALGASLQAANLISSYATEQDFGIGLVRRTDIYCQRADGPVRIEMMWRRRTSRAEIANYVLQKMFNYAKAIRFLQ